MSIEFKRDIEHFMVEVDESVANKSERICSYMWSQLVQNGAKASGAFTANFYITANSPSSKWDKNKTSAIQPNIAYKPYTNYFLTSNTPYANRLEYGWSKKQRPPTGLFKVTAHAAGVKFK